MKQIIVLIAMVVLGIAIAGFVSEFKTSAKSITTDTNKKITMDLFDTK